MKRISFILAAVLVLPAAVFSAGYRAAGDIEIVYESLGSGGASFATNGAIKLGGTLGQSGFVTIGTNTSGQVFLNGFWKAEDGCVLYNPSIVSVSRGANGVGVTFLVVNSNTYSVLYVDQEKGGVMAGDSYTSAVVTPFLGEGLSGTTTTIWDNVVSATNRARYYLIRCE